MKVIPVPSQLDERTFDQLVQPLQLEGGERVLVDARKVRWVDPYGMLGLLAVGDVASSAGERPILQLPESPDIISYLSRMRFFEQADELYEMHGNARKATDGVSDVLLEITPIRSHNDVHTVIDKVHASALVILMKQLNFAREEAMHFSVLLSELCQNIIEHAQADGWVATQTYSKTPQLDRRVVKIAVMDMGVGFKGSLNSSLAARYGDRWSDATALEAAFMHGLTRFHDPGRGQGLQQIRRQVGKLGGKIAIRSGTARIADVPDWEDTPPLEEKLPSFPGSQISVVLPAREKVEPKVEPSATTSSGRPRRRSA